MERRRDNIISILNDDDNPSFFIPPSEPAKGETTLPCLRDQLRLWAPSSGGFSRDSPIFSPASPTLYHNDFVSSQPPALTPSPEPPAYSYRRSPQARSARSYATPPYGNTAERLSIQSITNPSRSCETEPVSPQSTRSGTGDLTAPKASKKNKYPCPYSASHGCTATFTTSGHAARHGKKHTGEKSVRCPICNKAFTRKDNMKQHKRTHRSAITSEDSRIQSGSSSSSKWNKQPRDSTSLSHSDVDAPPTPVSDRSSSNQSSFESTSFAFDADEAVRRLTRGEAAKRRSVSSRSGLRSNGLDSLADVASTPNQSSRQG